MSVWFTKAVENSEMIFSVIGTVLLVLIGGLLLIKSGDILIDRLFRVKALKGKSIEGRELTLINLLQSVLRYSIYFIMSITILERIGVPVLALLSTAGVLGVGIAFGAQSLFKDVITGFFILMENQYAVGEYIETQGVQGYVEKITLRCTYLRDFGGQLHIIPNGTISLVTNHNRGNSRAVLDLRVAYEDDLKRTLAVLEGVCELVKGELASILDEGPYIWGIVRLEETALVVRIVARAKSMEQWTVERTLRQRVWEAFDREGIKQPYPQTIINLQGGPQA